jgi:3-oxoacyl-[acyl-carrier-protein] synthase II
MTRVVVTGVGAVTPVGNDAPSMWRSLVAGRSGIDNITMLDATPYGGAVAGEVKHFHPESLLPAKELRHMDRSAQFACVAALEAVRDAGLETGDGLGPSAGVVFGVGSGGYTLLDQEYHVLSSENSARRLSPFFLTNILPDASSGHIAILTGATGPNMAVISACATGAGSLGEASEIIRRGDADVVIAGGSEAPLTPMMFAAFAALRAVASPDEVDPAKSCKPFDRRRDGFVVAEGAGAVVLEGYEHARARGAPVYAELTGYGSSNDAFDMVASEEAGRGPVLSAEMALRKAGLNAADIGYVNAHGTGTVLNDRVETRALKRIFGQHAYKVPISSTKSMMGHLMGAAGAVEAIVSVMALREGIVPPTMHLDVPDPECDLDYVPNESRRIPGLQAVMSTSIGLGGHNAALIFTRV